MSTDLDTPIADEIAVNHGYDALEHLTVLAQNLHMHLAVNFRDRDAAEIAANAVADVHKAEKCTDVLVASVKHWWSPGLERAALSGTAIATRDLAADPVEGLSEMRISECREAWEALDDAYAAIGAAITRLSEAQTRVAAVEAALAMLSGVTDANYAIAGMLRAMQEHERPERP